MINLIVPEFCPSLVAAYAAATVISCSPLRIRVWERGKFPRFDLPREKNRQPLRTDDSAHGTSMAVFSSQYFLKFRRLASSTPDIKLTSTNHEYF